MTRLPYSPRPAAEEDISQVSAIEAASIRPPWTPEAFRAELSKAHSHFWVVTDNETDDRVLAYAVFSFPAEQAHLVTIAVAPELRKKGIATYLLRQIISFVMRGGGQSVILEVRKGNMPAVSFYQRIGFVVIRTISRFYPDGEDGYVMLYRTEQSRLTSDREEEGSGAATHGKKNFN